MLLPVTIVMSLLIVALCGLLGLARSLAAGDLRGAGPPPRSEARLRGLRAVEAALLEGTS